MHTGQMSVDNISMQKPFDNGFCILKVWVVAVKCAVGLESGATMLVVIVRFTDIATSTSQGVHFSLLHSLAYLPLLRYLFGIMARLSGRSRPSTAPQRSPSHSSGNGTPRNAKPSIDSDEEAERTHTSAVNSMSVQATPCSAHKGYVWLDSVVQPCPRP
jgi:hypothetical protein